MLLTVKELAATLHLKETTLYAWAKAGKIPCRRLNSAVRFDPEDIARWLDACRPTIPAPLPRSLTKGTPPEIDTTIARAKRQAYNFLHGEARPKSGLIGKEETDGAV